MNMLVPKSASMSEKPKTTSLQNQLKPRSVSDCGLWWGGSFKQRPLAGASDAKKGRNLCQREILYPQNYIWK